MTAQANMDIDLTWAYAIAYHAMMRASRALIYSKGYLPMSRKSHKTIVELTKMILGDEYESIISRFSRMRRRRHDFIYDSKCHSAIGDGSAGNPRPVPGITAKLSLK